MAATTVTTSPADVRVLPEFRPLPSLRMARTSRWLRRIARAMVFSLVLCVIGMLFLPWQQTVAGSGSVIAYAPTERQQVIEAPIKGRLESWGVDIAENAFVEKGQVIAEIRDLDTDLLSRLESQENAIERQITAYTEQIDSQRQQLNALQTILPAYESQVAAFKTVREQSLSALDAYLELARQKIRAEGENITGARATVTQTEADYIRQKTLFEDGLASEAKFQEAEQKYIKAKTELGKATAYLEVAQQELTAKTEERTAKDNELSAKIDSQTATLRKAESDVAKASSEIAKVTGELAKAEKELLDIQVKLSRQRSQTILAPRSGYLLELAANEGQIIKEGDRLCVLVPETSDRAVSVWVDGNDAPLVEPGRHVRLQFEGWPAVQFTGWPSVAIGTFGGEVLSVDATDDGNGKFRVLIGRTEGEKWPEERYLRQGVRANSWILLNQVPLGYEMWRRINGFPPVTKDKSEKKEEKKSDAKKFIKATKG